MARRHYNNTAVPVALTADCTSGATSLQVAATSGFPTTPFTIGIERGTPDEEVCLVTAVPDSTHLTVTRGYDGTTGKAHSTDDPVEHCVIAMDYDEANAHVNDSSLHQGAPSGTVLGFMGSEASCPSGWLICDGRAVSRATYSALHTILKDAGGSNTYVHGAGDGSTTFNLPDLRGRVLLGRDNMGGSSANRVVNAQADAFGGNAGAETVALSSSEMPSHTHTQNSHTHTQNAHTHTQNAHRHAPLIGGNFMTDVAGGGGYAGGIAGTVTNATADTVATNQSTTATNNATTATNQNTGGGAAHNNMPPYLTTTAIIKT